MSIDHLSQFFDREGEPEPTGHLNPIGANEITPEAKPAPWLNPPPGVFS